MIVENLTGHTVTVLLWWDKVKHIFPSEKYPKLKVNQSSEIVGEIGGVPVLSIKFDTKSTNMPPKKRWVVYIVSSVAAQASDRDDFYIVGDTVRGVDRRTILGCRWICKNPYFKQ